MTKLHDHLRTLLSTSRGRWYDGLAPELADHVWRAMSRMGITTENYGTARVLSGDPASHRLGGLMHDAGFDRSTPLERYDAVMLSRYGVIGLREPQPDFDAMHFEHQMRRALGMIGIVPGPLAAVRALVWSVTPVGVEGPEFDTGYSDPAVPFSIFLGAHSVHARVTALRMAEGVLHETMHLQLSLIEDVVPLVNAGTELRQSPWQMRPRPTQGILHGLYVFRVVQDWFRQLVAEGALDEADLRHALRRIDQIDHDCSGLSDLAESEELTQDGRTLVEALAA